MSDTPLTVNAEGSKPSSFAWDDTAELRMSENGGGVFHRFKTIRRGTMAELIHFVMDLPEEKRQDYAIQKDGDRVFEIGEIRSLSRRADFPVQTG